MDRVAGQRVITTEALILERNPVWSVAGETGNYLARCDR